jgi:hypothetical protein
MHTRTMRILVMASAVLLAAAATASAQTITSPKQHFGFNIGDDFQPPLDSALLPARPFRGSLRLALARSRALAPGAACGAG